MWELTGLSLNARDYEMQLMTAEVEIELELYESSYLRLNQIIENCQDKSIIKKAKRIIKELDNKKIVFEGKVIPDMKRKYIYMLRTADVEDIYIEALRNKLEAEYRISIIVINENIVPTTNNYIDRHAEYFLRVKDDFIDKDGSDTYDQIIEILDLDKDNVNEKEVNKEFVHFLYLQTENGEEKWQENLEKIQDQYDANEIFKQIKNTYSDRIKEIDCLGLLVVVPYDIYTKDYNFLFGWNGNDVAVMSYNRFIRGNQELTVKIKRIVMQGLSSVGFLIGIPRCTVDTCARAYPHSLEEHDAKDDALCNECKDNLFEVYSTF